MSLPILPGTASKMLLAISLAVIYFSGYIMHESYQKATDAYYKRDSIQHEIAYLLSTVDTGKIMSEKLSRNSVSDTLNLTGKISSNISINKDSLAQFNQVTIKLSRKLLHHLQMYQSRIDLVVITLKFSGVTFVIGCVMMCLGFFFIVFDENLERKMKMSKRYY